MTDEQIEEELDKLLHNAVFSNYFDWMGRWRTLGHAIILAAQPDLNVDGEHQT